MRSFLINTVCCLIVYVLAGVIVVEGKMRKTSMSFIGLVVFYATVSSVLDILSFL